MQTIQSHKRSIPAFLTAGLMLLFIWSCERAGPVQPTQGGLQPTLSSIQANIFSQKCALSGCHLGSSAPLGLELSEGKARGNLVNVASQEAPKLLRVAPGNPDQSYIIRKIEGAPGIIGERMPRGRDPLSQAEIDAIRQWIQDGAPDN